MERFNALSRGSQIMLVAGVLLLIDTFFAWQRVEVLDVVAASASAWNGFWGIMLGLLTIALVAWLVMRLLEVDVQLPVSDALLGAVIAALILLFALVKILADDFTATWAYVGLVLAAIIAIGAWLNVQESGGVEALRSETSGLKGGATATTAGTAATAPEPGPTSPPAASDPAPPAPPPSPEPPPAAPDPSPPATPPDTAPGERTP